LPPPRKPAKYEKWEYRSKASILGDNRNLFLLSLEFLALGAVVSLASLGETRATVYLTVLAMVYLAETLFFKVKRKTRVDFLGVVLLVVFVWGIGLSFFSS
jgi:hypothetical protein